MYCSKGEWYVKFESSFILMYTTCNKEDMALMFCWFFFPSTARIYVYYACLQNSINEQDSFRIIFLPNIFTPWSYHNLFSYFDTTHISNAYNNSISSQIYTTAHYFHLMLTLSEKSKNSKVHLLQTIRWRPGKTFCHFFFCIFVKGPLFFHILIWT